MYNKHANIYIYKCTFVQNLKFPKERSTPTALKISHKVALVYARVFIYVQLHKGYYYIIIINSFYYLLHCAREITLPLCLKQHGRQKANTFTLCCKGVLFFIAFKDIFFLIASVSFDRRQFMI